MLTVTSTTVIIFALTVDSLTFSDPRGTNMSFQTDILEDITQISSGGMLIKEKTLFLGEHSEFVGIEGLTRLHLALLGSTSAAPSRRPLSGGFLHFSNCTENTLL